MKKLFGALLLLQLTVTGFSQKNTSSVMGGEEVSNAFNLYIGPNFRGGVGALIMMDLEFKMFNENLTLGPTLGAGIAYYPHTVADYNNGLGYTVYSTKIKPTFVVSPGVVAHYYFDWLIPNMSEKYDVFAKTKVAGIFAFDSDVDYFVPVDVTFQVGGRINMSDSFSFYGAVGYGHSYVNVGMSLKL